MTVQQEHAQEWPPCWGNFGCRIRRFHWHAGIQMHMVWRTLVKVDRFFPSSKLCCICHVQNVELQWQDRWQCPNCQTDHQRDENAVVNLFVEGLRILAEGRSVIACGDTVRLERQPKHMSAKQETSLETCGHVA